MQPQARHESSLQKGSARHRSQTTKKQDSVACLKSTASSLRSPQQRLGKKEGTCPKQGQVPYRFNLLLRWRGCLCLLWLLLRLHCNRDWRRQVEAYGGLGWNHNVFVSGK